MPLSFVPLSRDHDRSAFRCGEYALDEWFRKRAGQDERRDIARVFLAIDDEGHIAGFYSLGAFSLSLNEIPEKLAGKLPKYDRILAALIGRLARDQSLKGKGIGELLLADAIRRILSAAQGLAVFAIIVDAKNASASDFYKSFGFIPFPAHPERLFMLTSTAVAAFGKI